MSEVILELINGVKLTADKKAKEDQLAQLQELILHQHVALLDDYFESILEFEAEKLVDVRKWVAAFVEAVCKFDAKYVPKSVATIMRLLSDENVNVVKRAIQASSHILSRGLEFILHPGITITRSKSAGRGGSPTTTATATSTAAVTQLEDQLQQLRNRLVTLMGSENAGIASGAVNFVASAILALTADGGGATHGQPLPSVEARAMLKELVEHLNDSAAASKATAIINSLLNVGRQRRGLLGDIIPRLVTFMASVSDASDARKKSISHTLKTALNTISKLPAASNWLDDIQEVLGTKPRAKRPAGDASGEESSAKRPKAREVEAIAAAAPVAFVGPPSAAIPPTYVTPSGVPISSTTFITHATFPVPLQALNIISTLAPELVAGLVFENLALVPVFTPSTEVVEAHHISTPTPTAEPSITSGASSTSTTSGIPQTYMPIVPETLGSSHLVGAVSRVVSHLKRRKMNTVDGDVAFLDDSNLAHLSSIVPITEDITYEQIFQHIATLLSSASTVQYGKHLLMTWLTREYVGEFVDKDKSQANESKKDDAMVVDEEEGHHNNNDNNNNNNRRKTAGRYEIILSKALAMFRDVLDPNHSIFSAFVFELPDLPDIVFDELTSYCGDKTRNKIGLQSLRDLLLYRQPIRNRCLNILLEYTSHPDDSIRSSAIVQATRLFLQPQFTDAIKEHALSLWLDLNPAAPKPVASGSSTGPSAEPGSAGNISIKQEPKSGDAMDVDPPTEPETMTTEPSAVAASSQQTPQDGVATTVEEPVELPEPEIRRKMLLYFALCAKKHDLLERLVKFYVSSGPAVRGVIQKEMTGLIPVVGQESPELLELIARYPEGSEPLIHQILRILTESTAPAPILVRTVMHIYKNRIADARFLIPILPGIPTAEAIALLPKLLVLPSASLKAALLRILHSKPAPLSPRELLVHLHLLNPTKDEVPLRKILEAMQVCFEDKTVVNQDCLAGVLQQLVDVTPIPPLFMRTVILSVSKVKTMMNSIMSLLTRLIIKQVWNDAGLWEGYMKCVKMTVPHSIPIMLSLPPPQFEELLTKNPDLRLKIVDYQKTVQRGIPASLQGIMDRLAAEAEAAAAAAKAAAAEEAAKKEAAIKADEYDPSAAAEDDDNTKNAPQT